VYNRYVSKSKRLLSKFWKLIPSGLRWHAVWAVSPRFVVGATGIVFNDEDEVLLARHVYRDKHPWGPLGGIVNYKESLPEAVRREILEETGLQVEVGPLLQIGVGTRWPNITHHFLCRVQGSPRPQINGELFEADFYSLDALPAALDDDMVDLLAYALQASKRPAETLSARVVQLDI
jgi:ADP-ribose pyrophosphatase YjhB (NUDIX family)